jgi:hypothetical protein
LKGNRRKQQSFFFKKSTTFNDVIRKGKRCRLVLTFQNHDPNQSLNQKHLVWKTTILKFGLIDGLTCYPGVLKLRLDYVSKEIEKNWFNVKRLNTGVDLCPCKLGANQVKTNWLFHSFYFLKNDVIFTFWLNKNIWLTWVTRVNSLDPWHGICHVLTPWLGLKTTEKITDTKSQ